MIYIHMGLIHLQQQCPTFGPWGPDALWATITGAAWSAGHRSGDSLLGGWSLQAHSHCTSNPAPLLPFHAHIAWLPFTMRGAHHLFQCRQVVVHNGSSLAPPTAHIQNKYPDPLRSIYQRQSPSLPPSLPLCPPPTTPRSGTGARHRSQRIKHEPENPVPQQEQQQGWESTHYMLTLQELHVFCGLPVGQPWLRGSTSQAMNRREPVSNPGSNHLVWSEAINELPLEANWSR